MFEDFVVMCLKRVFGEFFVGGRLLNLMFRDVMGGGEALRRFLKRGFEEFCFGGGVGGFW